MSTLEHAILSLRRPWSGLWEWAWKRPGKLLACRCRILVFGLVILAGDAFGQAALTSPAANPKAAAQGDLSQISLEDLMNLKVTSVSKTQQKMSQAAAAIFVITREDIHRSGATNIPDLLRIVPGLDVAQINASTWAISARGFNQQFSNKLLVLIDGRALYTPLLGGVNWDTQDVPLEDIDRIEVIRGPGATVWGSNAVNGVINIVTKKASETKGGLITGGGGTEGQVYGTAQYGGTIRGDANYRIFTKYVNHSSQPQLDGSRGNDSWDLLRGGFRTDSTISAKDSLTVQGGLYTGREGATIVHLFSIAPPVNANENVRSSLSGGNVLGRWGHSFSSRSDTTLQLYFDNFERTVPESDETRNTIDIDFNHHFIWGTRQEIIWGIGYRHTWDQDNGTIDQSFVPSNTSLQLFNSYIQDTITLDPDRVLLTVGTKLEDSYYSGAALEPSIRLAWTPSNRETFWAAVSHADRTPDQRDVSLAAALAVFPDPAGSANPVEVVLFGNSKFQSEEVIAYEAGYRSQPLRPLSVDLSLFINDYYHLSTTEPGQAVFQQTPAPARILMPITFANLMHGTTEGVELAANLKLTDRWTLSPSYSFLEMHLHTSPSSLDATSVAEFQGSSPQHQAQLRSLVELSHGLTWDASAFFVSALPADSVPSYTRIDTQLTWKFAESADFSIVGQNLLRDHHLESNNVLTLVNPALMKRSAYGKLTWRF